MRVKVDSKKLVELFNTQSKLVEQYQYKMILELTSQIFNRDINKSRKFIYRFFGYEPMTYEECIIMAKNRVKNPAMNNFKEDPYGNIFITKLKNLLPPEDCVKVSLTHNEYKLFTKPYPQRSIYWAAKNIWI